MKRWSLGELLKVSPYFTYNSYIHCFSWPSPTEGVTGAEALAAFAFDPFRGRLKKSSLGLAYYNPCQISLRSVQPLSRDKVTYRPTENIIKS